MRYYVVSVQHNKDKDAENRSVPKAFDTELQARQDRHFTHSLAVTWAMRHLIGLFV